MLNASYCHWKPRNLRQTCNDAPALYAIATDRYCRSRVGGGWGSMPRNKSLGRLTCGVTALHHSHPLPLKTGHRTGWLGQYAPGTQARDRLSCGVAALHHSHPRQPRRPARRGLRRQPEQRQSDAARRASNHGRGGGCGAATHERVSEFHPTPAQVNCKGHLNTCDGWLAEDRCRPLVDDPWLSQKGRLPIPQCFPREFSRRQTVSSACPESRRDYFAGIA